MYYIGVDMGSTTCKVVIIDEQDQIVDLVVSQIMVDPISTIRKALSDLKWSQYKIKSIGVTGSARNLIA